MYIFFVTRRPITYTSSAFNIDLIICHLGSVAHVLWRSKWRYNLTTALVKTISYLVLEKVIHNLIKTIKYESLSISWDRMHMVKFNWNMINQGLSKCIKRANKSFSSPLHLLAKLLTRLKSKPVRKVQFICFHGLHTLHIIHNSGSDMRLLFPFYVSFLFLYIYIIHLWFSLPCFFCFVSHFTLMFSPLLPISIVSFLVLMICNTVSFL